MKRSVMTLLVLGAIATGDALAEEPAWEILLQEFSAFMGWREEAPVPIGEIAAL